jgi:hypothetical protein
VDLTHILVSNQKVGVLNDGANLCIEVDGGERFDVFHTWLCKKYESTANNKL